MEFEEKTLSSKPVYDGKIVKVFKDDVEISDGHKAFREVVRHSGGVVILAVKKDKREETASQSLYISSSNLTPTPTLPLGEGGATTASQNKILFVRQYRYPISKPLLELPAGKLEPDENPFLAAKRELEEETGYRADKWSDLGYVYTSPGYSDEKLYLYLAENLQYTNPHPDEGEILEPLEINYSDALEMIKTGEITDAKTLCAFMKFTLLLNSATAQDMS